MFSYSSFVHRLATQTVQTSLTRSFMTQEFGLGMSKVQINMFGILTFICRAAEESMIKRALQSFENLNGKNVLGDNWPKA